MTSSSSAWRIRAVHPELPLPVGALTLEAAALFAVTLALAAAGSRLAPERRGGVVAAPAILALEDPASRSPHPATHLYVWGQVSS